MVERISPWFFSRSFTLFLTILICMMPVIVMRMKKMAKRRVGKAIVFLSTIPSHFTSSLPLLLYWKPPFTRCCGSLPLYPGPSWAVWNYWPLSLHSRPCQTLRIYGNPPLYGWSLKSFPHHGSLALSPKASWNPGASTYFFFPTL